MGNEGNGLVFWKKTGSSRLPEDLVEEAGLLGADFEHQSEDELLGGYMH